MIDPNKPKSVLSRPNEGQDFDIVERTIKENKSFNENLIFNLVRNNEVIACVDFSDLIIDGALINDKEEIKESLKYVALGIFNNIYLESKENKIEIGDKLLLNEEQILEIDQNILDLVQNLNINNE